MLQLWVLIFTAVEGCLGLAGERGYRIVGLLRL